MAGPKSISASAPTTIGGRQVAGGRNVASRESGAISELSAGFGVHAETESQYFQDYSQGNFQRRHNPGGGPNLTYGSSRDFAETFEFHVEVTDDAANPADDKSHFAQYLPLSIKSYDTVNRAISGEPSGRGENHNRAY